MLALQFGIPGGIELLVILLIMFLLGAPILLLVLFLAVRDRGNEGGVGAEDASGDRPAVDDRVAELEARVAELEAELEAERADGEDRSRD